MDNSVHTLQEAAEILRLPYRTVRDAVFAGRWPHVMVSPRKRLMTDADIGATLVLLRQVAIASTPLIDARAQKERVRNLLGAA